MPEARRNPGRGRHVCTVISLERDPPSAAPEPPAPWEELVYTPPPSEPTALQRVASVFSLEPRQFRLAYERSTQNLVEDVIKSVGADVLIGYEWMAGYYGAHLRQSNVIRILDGCEPRAFLPGQRSLRLALRWAKFRRLVGWMAKRHDAVLATSSVERDWIVSNVDTGGTPVYVVPNGVDIPARGLPEFGRDLGRVIYTGSMTYEANLEAIRHFLAETWPRVRTALPNSRIDLTGELPPATVCDELEAHPGVALTGLLDDIAARVASSGVLVVPLLTGGGTRIKVLEALGAGCPVVSTTRGVEGLELGTDEAAVHDSPPEFADAVVRVLTDPGYRAGLVKAGRAYAHRHTWEVAGAGLIRVLEQSAAAARASVRP